MEYGFDTYGLYTISLISKFSIRFKLVMTEDVDITLLGRAVNTAIERYSYFKVKVALDPNGAYLLLPNDKPIVVLKSSKNNPKYATDEVNGHLLYFDCRANEIYFNISHSLAGGVGAFPLLMTSIYLYVKEKYGVEATSPDIRMPKSDYLSGENEAPNAGMLKDFKELNKERYKGAFMPVKDYIASIINPFKKSDEYFTFTFKQSDIVDLAKASGNSVSSFFNCIMFKSFDKLLDKKFKKIVAMNCCNPRKELGLPNSRHNILTHIFIPYERKMANWDYERLGTITRGSIILQSDLEIASAELYKRFNYLAEIDKRHGIKEKIKYAKRHNPTHGQDAVGSSFVVSYMGNIDWGELSDYISEFVIIADGHQLLELSSLDDKIFCNYNQMIRTDKYIRAFCKTLDETGISYSVKGPYKKNLVRHDLRYVTGSPFGGAVCEAD